MTPSPVFLLFFRGKLAKIAMWVAVMFIGPLVAIDHLVVIPDVIVAVVGVVNAVIMMLASRDEQGHIKAAANRSELAKRDLGLKG